MGSKIEKPEEIRAKLIFESVTSIELTSQENGEPSRVDYVSSYQAHDTALEVSRFTNHSQKSLWAGYKNKDSFFYVPRLTLQWLVTTEGVVRQDKLKEEIPRALLTLERMGLTSYDKFDYLQFEQDDLQEVLRIFRSNSIDYVRAGNHFFSARECDPRNVAVMPSQSYAYYGPDLALEIVEEFIATTPDNLSKLNNTFKSNRHLWLWLDSYSKKSVSDAFDLIEERVPTRFPILPIEINHLWIVNELNGYGWYFSPDEGWQVVREEAS